MDHRERRGVFRRKVETPRLPPDRRAPFGEDCTPAAESALETAASEEKLL
jgi:hypothetical protein